MNPFLRYVVFLIWRIVFLVLRSVRNIFGLYGQEYEESSKYNPTIELAWRRLSVDFKSIPEPSAPPPLPITPAPEAEALRMHAARTRKFSERLALYKATRVEIASFVDPKSRPPHFTKSDLYTLESALIEMCSPCYLIHIYPSIRERYRGIAGAEAYRLYIEGLRPDPKKTPLDTYGIRSDALHLLAEMRRLAIALPRREQIRTWLLVELLIVNGTVAILILAVLLVGRHPFSRYSWHPFPGAMWHHFPFAWIVAIWSLLGGIISVLRRLQTLPDEELNLAQWGRLPILLSPITSICFGLVLLHLFWAGVLTGSIFPNMLAIYHSSLPQTCSVAIACHPYVTDLGFDIFHWMALVSQLDLSKLIVWSFIAGFAENFVPDTLDSLVKRKKN